MEKQQQIIKKCNIQTSFEYLFDYHDSFMKKIELPLPPFYYQAKKAFHICSSFLLFTALASFSLLVENVTNLKVRSVRSQVAR